MGAELPLLRPVDLTAVPDRVPDLAAALVALDNACHACTLLSNQADIIKDSYCIRAALLTHLFTLVCGGEGGGRGGASGACILRPSCATCLLPIHQSSHHLQLPATACFIPTLWLPSATACYCLLHPYPLAILCYCLLLPASYLPLATH